MLQRLTSVPGMISLGGGLPHPSQFPIDSLTMNVADKALQVSSEDLRMGLQYSGTQGLVPLVEFFKTLQTAVHSPKLPFDICIGSGSQVFYI